MDLSLGFLFCSIDPYFCYSESKWGWGGLETPLCHLRVLIFSLVVIFQGLQQKGHAAATVKSLQSCPTLCDPTDSSPPGSSVPGILQARILEWVAISFSKKGHTAFLFWCYWQRFFKKGILGVHFVWYKHSYTRILRHQVSSLGAVTLNLELMNGLG